jgi:hypothetical protein
VDKWENRRQSDMSVRETKLRTIKTNESAGLRKRLQTGRDELKKQKQHELERCVSLKCRFMFE